MAYNYDRAHHFSRPNMNTKNSKKMYGPSSENKVEIKIGTIKQGDSFPIFRKTSVSL